ncbi:hypothetical protein [Actinomadura sp. B10D3]|uniref:hypothetical protein n=1 Tax=Actinomadura sp. B10D3 TaxID=3153557 RepID=UPI00325C389E
MKIRIGRVIAGAMALAAAATMATISNASAGSWDHVYKAQGATVYVEEYGDIIKLCDSAANGHGAWINVGDHNSSYTFSVAGKGSCKTRRASMGTKYNMAENKTVWLFWDGLGNSSTNYGSQFLNDH